MLDFDTAVIGAGPAGLMASLYLKRAGISTILIDKDAPGGQMLKTSKIENYLGFETISGSELALKMFNHVKANDIPFEFAEVSLIKKDNFGYIVVAGPKEIHVKHIIIATGRKPLKLNLKNENVIKGISYCAVCDGSFYKDKVVGVVGGGNSAFTNALYLADLCHQVYLFVRSSIKADQELVNKVHNRDNIVILTNCAVAELKEKDQKLTAVILEDGKRLDLEGLFVAIGGKPATQFIQEIELENGYIKVNENMETSVKGIYAAGDVVSKKYYQIATAISDGAIAALAIKAGK